MVADRDDVRAARELLWGGGGVAAARCVLFDFDGPVCRLFPEGSSREVADRLRHSVAEAGVLDVLTDEERQDKDPHVVLRAVHRAGHQDLVAALERQVTEGERAAADTAWPTPDADGLIHLLHERGLALSIVTNNSPLAPDRYLRRLRLRGLFASVHGRGPDPDLMKPHPDVLVRALQHLHLPADQAVMIGDTPTDVEAAAGVGVRFIGYGRNEEKRARLRKAGADVVLGQYAGLLLTERASGPGQPADPKRDSAASATRSGHSSCR